jgi:hypothetical protein
MGCLNKVFHAEIDVDLFRAAERTRLGFGGVKMSGTPLPQCRLSVDQAYDGAGEAFECVNPDFFETPRAEVNGNGNGAGAFDLRDSL